MLEMEQPESPTSSDSAHTPLQDEHIDCDVKTPTDEILVNIEIGENVDMIEEQLDYEEFVENNEVTKVESEAEEGEYNSSDDNEVLICDDEEKKSILNNESQCDNEEKSDVTKHVSKVHLKKNLDDDGSDIEVVANDDSKCEGELAEGELKAEEDIPMEETPWERGLRLARERRELAKLKKVQEKDKLKERQLHINLDNVEEVEPISKPQIETNYEVNHKLLKAMQPIVILPEEPKHNEMILEYYLAESDYQHRPRFIPSRLYTLDPWEVEEWKRELDMMKMESEMERIASNKHKRLVGTKSLNRPGRRGSVSSSGSSRSSSVSGNKIFNQTNRTYEFQTSQYALSRNKPLLNKNEKPLVDDPISKVHVHRGRRDLPPEFKNRIVSSSRSSSRSSSGSHSSSSGSSSSSRSTSSHRDSPKKRPIIPIAPKTTQPFRTIKKPALGRARSDSSASSKSSDSSSTSSDSSSSGSSGSSGDSRKARKSKSDKQFINSWFTKTPQNPLEATIVTESNLSSQSVVNKDNVNGSNELASYDVANAAVAGPENIDCELPSASSRPGVKLKLLSRPKPVILPNQSASKTPVKPTVKDKANKKGSTTKSVPSATVSKPQTNNLSNIFNNNKAIFSTSSTTSQKSSEIAATAKETTFKSNLAATQLEMQQEFLRNYKDKIAIYRSQLSYQQQNPVPGQHPGTLTHTQPPPIKGPITVMSVTSKKTGPPKTQVKVTDRYSQHEEHSRRYNHHYSPNYRNDFRDGASNRNKHDSRNRSRSFENDRGDWDKSRDHERGRNYFDKAPRDYNDKSRLSDNFRPRNDYGDKLRDNNRSYNDGKFRDKHDKFDRGDRNRFDGGPDRPARNNDFDRNNRFERGDDRPRRGDDRNYRGRDFNRNKDFDQFTRDDRPRERFREPERDFEDRYSDNNVDKRFDAPDTGKHREDNFEISKPRPRNLDRNSISEAVTTTNHIEEVVPKPATQLPVTVVSKEKRREELLNQLKAVEDAIAKKKAKIDK